MAGNTAWIRSLIRCASAQAPITRITRVLAWLTGEAPAREVAAGLLDMLEASGREEKRRYARLRPIACLTKTGQGPSQKRHINALARKTAGRYRRIALAGQQQRHRLPAQCRHRAALAPQQ